MYQSIFVLTIVLTLFVSLALVLLAFESRHVKKFLDSVHKRSENSTSLPELKSIRGELIEFSRSTSHKRYMSDIVWVLRYLDGKIDGLSICQVSVSQPAFDSASVAKEADPLSP